MRLLQVTTMYVPEHHFGGPPQKIHSLSTGLRARGMNVDVVTHFSTDSDRYGATEINGVPVYYLPWRSLAGRQLPRRAGMLRGLVAQADLVHIYGLYNALGPLAAAQARRFGKPFVLEPLGMYVPRTRNQHWKRLYHVLFTHRLLRDAAAVVATSPPEYDELRLHVAKGRLLLRRNGIDTGWFANPTGGAAFRQAHDIPLEAALLLFVGRLNPIKNLVALVHAFAGLDHTCAHLLLVGPPSDPDYVVELDGAIAAQGLQDRVRRTGALYDEQVLAALDAADLLVLPSLYESFGNAAAEAVAAGLPVLVSDRCGIAPLIASRAGLAVPPTVPGLRDGLQALLDPAQRTALTTNQAVVISELSWEQPLDQMQQLYAKIARRSTRS